MKRSRPLRRSASVRKQLTAVASPVRAFCANRRFDIAIVVQVEPLMPLPHFQLTDAFSSWQQRRLVLESYRRRACPCLPPHRRHQAEAETSLPRASPPSWHWSSSALMASPSSLHSSRLAATAKPKPTSDLYLGGAHQPPSVHARRIVPILFVPHTFLSSLRASPL